MKFLQHELCLFLEIDLCFRYSIVLAMVKMHYVLDPWLVFHKVMPEHYSVIFFCRVHYQLKKRMQMAMESVWAGRDCLPHCQRAI